MFPIDKRLVHVVMYPAPDVVPQMLHALDDVPVARWNAAESLEDLAARITPELEAHGARPFDFIWSMERHFSFPYGPLPKATQAFMAGIPDMFIGGSLDGVAADRARDLGGVLAAQADLNLTDQADTEVLARPFQYEASSDMPEDYRYWVEKLMFAHGECMDPYFGDDAREGSGIFDELDGWSIKQAPDAESRLRFSNFHAEEYKHTYQFYKVYSAFDPTLPARIFAKEQEVFRAYSGMVTESWLDRAINNCLSDRFGVYQGFEWVQSSYAPFARVALKVVKDERGHSNMGYLHLRDCLERDPEAHRYAQRRINEFWYPYFMAAFGADDSENNLAWRRWGLKQHRNPVLRAAYHREVEAMLTSLNLGVAPMEVALDLGRELASAARSAGAH